MTFNLGEQDRRAIAASLGDGGLAGRDDCALAIGQCAETMICACRAALADAEFTATAVAEVQRGQSG